MKHEKVFSDGGFYQVVLTSNALLHAEAARIGSEIVVKWLKSRNGTDPVRVLDLACGGMPHTILEIIKQNEGYGFEYCGIDINPDQVAKAALSLESVDNVLDIKVLEGDIWNLGSLGLDMKFDLVFTGLNLHHGSCDQIRSLFNQLIPHLSGNALFLNHDFYRPSACNEDRADITSGSDWRAKYVNEHIAYLRRYCADENGMADNAAHIMKYDHPLSVGEVATLIKEAGYAVKTHQMTRFNHPLGRYFAVVEAYRKT